MCCCRNHMASPTGDDLHSNYGLWGRWGNNGTNGKPPLTLRRGRISDARLRINSEHLERQQDIRLEGDISVTPGAERSGTWGARIHTTSAWRALPCDAATCEHRGSALQAHVMCLLAEGATMFGTPCHRNIAFQAIVSTPKFALLMSTYGQLYSYHFVPSCD